MQRRVCGDEGVEIPDHLVFPEESGRPVPVYRKANHLTPIVNRCHSKGLWSRRPREVFQCLASPFAYSTGKRERFRPELETFRRLRPVH